MRLKFILMIFVVFVNSSFYYGNPDYVYDCVPINGNKVYKAVFDILNVNKQ